MRIVVQRVSSARLSIAANEQVVSQIGKGLMVLVGITHGDNEVDIDYLCPKILALKLWGDGSKAWSKGLKDMNY